MTETPKTKKTVRRILQGVVARDAADKTRVVVVSRTKIHPKYKKRYTVSKRYLAHDERNEYHTGDVVRCIETRPLSRRKRFAIIGKVESPKT